MNIKLLEKYFAGKATSAEKEKVLKFFEQENLNATNEQTMHEWWQQYLTENEDKKVELKVLQHIHQQMEIEKVNKRRVTPWLKIAAMLVVFFSVALVIYNLSKDNSGEKNVASIETITKQTPLGAKLQVTLPDGSLVFLNAGSKISYPAQFTGNQRLLSLEGEAYFEVVHDSLRPFVVDCRQVSTLVLGTSFNLSGYEEKPIVVSLTSGKVQVDFDQSDLVILQPGEELTYHQDTYQIKVNEFDPYLVTGWKDGILIFDENNLSEIIRKLERWYGVQISLGGINNPNQLQWNYSGEFDNENLVNVLSGIAYVKGFDYEIDGKQVILKF